MCGLYPGGTEAALLDWKYRGSRRSPGGTHTVTAGERSRERTHLYKQANTDKQIQAGEDAQVLSPAARATQNHLGSSQTQQLVYSVAHEHGIQGGKECP